MAIDALLGRHSDLVICIMMSGGRVLLKQQNGEWIGISSELKKGESAHKVAERSVAHETGVNNSDLFYHGILMHVNQKGRSMKVHYFSSEDFDWNPSEGRGIRWFSIDSLPKNTRQHERKAMHAIVNRERLEADYIYDKHNKRYIDSKLHTPPSSY